MQRIGRYEILKELGRGAMGAVFQARDPQIGRTVAIKVILTANLSADDLAQYKQRFVREAQAAGQMSHPGIVTIHDIAEDETGQPFLVMEFIEGQPLDRQMEAAGAELLPLAKSLDIAIQVAQALDYAHRRGVIHRDIKPANILIPEDGHCKIADFGIAKLSGVQLTQTGHLLGTPAYMSPEQFSGAAVDARSDLFSLGAMLYWMVTGEKPFAGDTLTAVSFKVVFTAPIPVHQLNPALPPDLDTVISRCLAKSPADRYATGRDLAADLEAVKNGKPIAATPVSVAATPAAEPTIATARTTVALPVPPPKAASGVPIERTVAISAPEKTVPMPHAARPELTMPIPPPIPLRKTRWGLWLGLAAPVLFIALIIAWWNWPGPQERESDSRPASAREREKRREPEGERSKAEQPPEPSDSGTPATKASPRTRRSQSAPAGAMSTLHINCQHNFREAALEIAADGDSVFKTTLRGQSQELAVMRIYQGTLRTSVPIRAGQHVLRVRVSSRADNYEGEEEIGGNFSADGSRSLSIEFGKGSGFGVFERKLTLRWR